MPSNGRKKKAQKKKKTTAIDRSLESDDNSKIFKYKFQGNQRDINLVHDSNGIIASGSQLAWNFRLWDGSIYLSRFLEENQVCLIRNNVVIELGAGTALVSLTVARLGARTVFVTDLPHAIPLIEHNVRNNFKNNSCKLDKVAGLSTGYTPQCANGHILIANKTDCEGYQCNVCDSEIDENCSLYRCHECNFDLCGTCHFQVEIGDVSNMPVWYKVQIQSQCELCRSSRDTSLSIISSLQDNDSIVQSSTITIATDVLLNQKIIIRKYDWSKREEAHALIQHVYSEVLDVSNSLSRLEALDGDGLQSLELENSNRIPLVPPPPPPIKSAMSSVADNQVLNKSIIHNTIPESLPSMPLFADRHMPSLPDQDVTDAKQSFEMSDSIQVAKKLPTVHIVAADVTYSEEAVRLFIQALEDLRLEITGLTNTSVVSLQDISFNVILLHHRRTTETNDLLWASLRQAGYVLTIHSGSTSTTKQIGSISDREGEQEVLPSAAYVLVSFSLLLPV